MATIDITPTRSEYARICAYILSNRWGISPSEFGDYWNYTPEEEETLIRLYQVFVANKKAN
jgi:hypothetical protein